MQRTLGVEEEFLLVDADTSTLRPLGGEVAKDATTAADGQFEHELKREQVEHGTSVHTSVADLSEQLSQRRSALAAAADRHGSRLAALGTNPLPAVAHTTREERYERMQAEFGQIAETQVACGMHVHVSIGSRAEGVAALDRMRPWLPVLLALGGNSPFWWGMDTEYESYRSILWGQWPTAGTPPAFGSVAAYDGLVEDLVRSGAAIDAGMLYFDARLSQRYPTIEVRAADVSPYAGDAVTIAATVRALVAAAATDESGPPRVRDPLIRAAAWRAARWGLTGELVDVREGAVLRPAWELVEALLAYVGDELDRAGDRDVVARGLRRIRERGTGAQLQRRVLHETGCLTAVVDAVCRHTLEPAAT